MTALHSAAYGGHANTAEVLLECGADANARTDDDSSPLHAAATIGYAGISAICELRPHPHVHWLPFLGRPEFLAAQDTG